MCPQTCHSSSARNMLQGAYLSNKWCTFTIIRVMLRTLSLRSASSCSSSSSIFLNIISISTIVISVILITIPSITMVLFFALPSISSPAPIPSRTRTSASSWPPAPASRAGRCREPSPLPAVSWSPCYLVCDTGQNPGTVISSNTALSETRSAGTLLHAPFRFTEGALMTQETRQGRDGVSTADVPTSLGEDWLFRRLLRLLHGSYLKFRLGTLWSVTARASWSSLEWFEA